MRSTATLGICADRSDHPLQDRIISIVAPISTEISSESRMAIGDGILDIRSAIRYRRVRARQTGLSGQKKRGKVKSHDFGPL